MPVSFSHGTPLVLNLQKDQGWLNGSPEFLGNFLGYIPNGFIWEYVSISRSIGENISNINFWAGKPQYSQILQRQNLGQLLRTVKFEALSLSIDDNEADYVHSRWSARDVTEVQSRVVPLIRKLASRGYNRYDFGDFQRS